MGRSQLVNSRYIVNTPVPKVTYPWSGQW